MVGCRERGRAEVQDIIEQSWGKSLRCQVMVSEQGGTTVEEMIVLVEARRVKNFRQLSLIVQL